MWLWRGNGSAGRFGARVTFDYGWVCLMIGKAGIEDERLGLMRMSKMTLPNFESSGSIFVSNTK